MVSHFTEVDWRLFKARIPQWQEAYMELRCKEYIALLSGDGSASERFWELENRIEQDKRDAGVQLEMRRSKFVDSLVELLRDKVITWDDLDGFSDELIETVRFIVNS